MDIEHYSQIIALPHHKSQHRAAMPVRNRAAQFAPFAALSGYENVIRETARVTEIQAELCEDRKAELNAALQRLAAGLDKSPRVCITYYVPDKYKKGGAYCKARDTVKRIDTVCRKLVLSAGTEIAFDTISDISEEI